MVCRAAARLAHGQGFDVEARRRNPRGEGGRLREEVIAAAMRVLDRSPAAALSLRNIAREVGVAPPSVYSQFPDAQSMFDEIARECWRQLGAEMSDAAERMHPADPLDVIKAQLDAYVIYAMGRPSRYQLLFALQTASQDADLDGPLRPAYRALLASVEFLAAQGGRLPAPDSASTALLIISMAHGRIALAHLAPQRAGNGVEGVRQFVALSLDRLLAAARTASDACHPTDPELTAVS